MKKCQKLLLAGLLASAILPAQASTVALFANGQWSGFTVDGSAEPLFGLSWIDADYSNSASYGSKLNFNFTIASGYVGTLTVLDAGIAGDVFAVTNNGALLGNTSAVTSTTYDPDGQSFDYDSALADSSFSRGVFTLAAGDYSISGSLIQSVMFDAATPLNSTSGAVKLEVAPVPAPAAVISMFSGLAALGLFGRRRHSI